MTYYNEEYILQLVVRISNKHKRRGDLMEMRFTLPEWRRLRNITVEKMAELCEVHVNTYRNWENKPSSIKLVKAEKIAEILNVSLDSIIFLP